ncbi:TPA: tail fiber domain-containing protein [Escherichia coli]
MIYTTGTIAIDGNTVTGTGTNFSAPLSLIRVGCTIIAVENPVQIFTITEIKSSTELSVTPAADPAIPAGTKFSILLSDSLSVDGLAQDVAETLRYYQGRETEISEAVEFFKNFNLQELKDLVKQTEDSANAAKTSEENAAQSEQGAIDIKNQTEQLKNETYQIKNDTQSIKDGADLARDSANTHANDAKSAKDAAESARDDAEQFAKQVNPENLLHKNKNLSDIADRAAAWLNVRPIGSTPLSGDPVDDYDATTKRWVLNTINTGTVGPTMNGVMNYGVGDFHLRDSRAYIQPYEVVSDGQLLNRADWPELWAYAQMLSPVTDAEWLADPAKRGKYSLGNGTTTFRVPDRNGVQSGSVPALFGRGDGGDSSHNGRVEESAAPDIKGSFTTISFVYSGGVYSLAQNRSGAFFVGESGTYSAINIDSVTSSQQSLGTDFSASKSSPVYGRQSASEIRPNSFYGVWVIRASGGFVAANTSWSVKNADATAPSSGTTVRGGEVISEYSNPAGKRFARLYSDTVWGSPGAATIEAEGAAKHAYKFYEDGTVDFRQSGKVNSFQMNTSMGTWGDIVTAGTVNLTTNGMDRIVTTSGSDVVVRGYSIGGYRPDGYPTKVGFHMYIPGNGAYGIATLTIGGDGGRYCQYFLDIDGQIYGSTNYNNFSYTKNGVSDYRVKHSISPVGVEKSYSNIQGLEFVEFIYDNDEQERVRHGVIAQQAETVEPLYVKTRKYVGINPGEVVEQKELDTTPMLLDTMHVTQSLILKATALEKENASLRANIAVMDERITKLEALVRQLTGSEE